MMNVSNDASANTFETLSDALHTLAQPLTALSFVVDMALLQQSPEAWHAGLESARTESRRAMDAMKQVLTIAAALRQEEVPTWVQP